jgi:allantoin racemase
MAEGETMRIGLIFVTGESSEPFFSRQVEARERLASSGTQLVVFPLNGPSQTLECEIDEVLAAPFILARVREAAESGCEAIVIDCALDPALAAASALVNVPVIGPGRSALALGSMLGDRIALLIHDAVALPAFRHRITAYGFTDRVISIRPLGVEILQMGVDRAVEEALEAACRRAMEEDGADVIVLGCTGLAPVAESVRSRLPVPLVEPAHAAIRIAEAVAGQRRTSGSWTRPVSLWLEVLGWPELGPSRSLQARAPGGE